MLLQAACDQGKKALILTSEVESTVAVAPVKHQVSMVDLWQPIKDNTDQQTTVGWERKLESAGRSDDISIQASLCVFKEMSALWLLDLSILPRGYVCWCAGNVQTWHRSDSGTAKSPLSQPTHEGQQEVPAAGKGQPIGASRSCAIILACSILH